MAIDKAEWWANELRSKGYRVETEQSNNNTNRTLYTVYHPSYCNGTTPLLGGVVQTQLKALSVADSNGWERRDKMSYTPTQPSTEV